VTVNFVTFVFISFMWINYLLPRRIAEEVVVSTKRKVHYVPAGTGGIGRRSCSSGGKMASEDTDYLQTKNFHFQVDGMQRLGL
jgi:hypothetical protein